MLILKVRTLGCIVFATGAGLDWDRDLSCLRPALDFRAKGLTRHCVTLARTSFCAMQTRAPLARCVTRAFRLQFSRVKCDFYRMGPHVQSISPQVFLLGITKHGDWQQWLHFL